MPRLLGGSRVASAGLGRSAGLSGLSVSGRSLVPPVPEEAARPRPPPRSSFSRAARLFFPSGNTFLRAASVAPAREGEAAGRRKVGQGADKGARSFGAFCLGCGAEPPRSLAAGRESPAAVWVPSLGSRARPLCELRGKKDGVFCRQHSDPPRHPKIADSHSNPCCATLLSWALLLLSFLSGWPNTERKKKCYVCGLIFSFLGKELKSR